MYQRIIVPVDGSAESWRAAGLGRSLADRFAAVLEIVSGVSFTWERQPVRDELKAMVAAQGWGDEVVVTVLDAWEHGVAHAIATHVESQHGALVVMSSTGKGRSAPLVGSVTDALVRELYGPILVVGPRATKLDLEGPLLVCVDGSHTSESILGAAGSWAVALHLTPWVVSVAEPVTVKVPGETVIETAYPHRVADRLSGMIERGVEFETLHGEHPDEAIVDYAERSGAALIAVATHGRTGLRRIAMGSVAMSIVHKAPCPVLLARPPHTEDED